MQGRTVAIVLFAASASAVVASFVFESGSGVDPAPTPVHHDETRDDVPEVATDATADARSPALDVGVLPSSLRDTEIDGALTLDADGRFVPDRGALALFDYFLSATGEQPAAALRAHVVAEIERRLPPDAAREAEAFLDRHLAYREAARRLGEDERLALGSDLERRLQWLRELRREHFGAALSERLFGDDERAVEIALERQRVAADPALSPEARRARIDALEAELPDAMRRARAAAVLPLRLHRDEAALRAAGADDTTIRALREASVGAEAADRLTALDERRAAWQARVDAYRAERAELDADASIEPAERAALHDAVRARHFDATEQLRVRALDETDAEIERPQF
jgi:lipase chaperone LimK